MRSIDSKEESDGSTEYPGTVAVADAFTTDIRVGARGIFLHVAICAGCTAGGVGRAPGEPRFRLKFFFFP